jgi:hypothetical protein
MQKEKIKGKDNRGGARPNAGRPKKNTKRLFFSVPTQVVAKVKESVKEIVNEFNQEL